jgi:hypothetical protein
MSVGDARTGVGLSDDGGLAKLSVGDADAGAKTGGARESDEIDDPSPGLSVVGCVVTDPLPEVKKAWLLHSSSIACFVLGSSTAPPALMASTTASSPNCPHQGISVIISTTSLVFFCVATAAGDCEFCLGGPISVTNASNVFFIPLADACALQWEPKKI